ncbi:MAG: HPr-rel-A system PqqD family peptide chaperone [Rubrivivax sp.]
MTAVPGVLLEELEAEFAAYSPLSGATHLLNDTSAALLEILRDTGSSGASPETVVKILAEEADVPSAELIRSIESHWGTLISAGLVRRQRPV